MKIYLLLFSLGACASLGLADSYRVALITDDTSNVFWQQVHAGAVKACGDLKAKGTTVDLTWDGPASDNDAAAEGALVRQKTDEKVDGIVLSPTADVPELFEPVAAAAKQGIPTVVINAGLRSVGQISFVSTNNYKGGTLAARKMGALLKGHGNVVVFRWLTGNAASGGRESGFINVIKGQYPGIKIVSDDIAANGTRDGARQAAADILRRFGTEADGVFAPTQVTSEALLQALRDAGVPAGKIKAIGFDSSAQLVQGLAAGELSGLVVQNPVNMGYEGVVAVVRHLQHQSVDPEIDTGCTMVTTDNLQDPAVQDLVHPPVAADAAARK